MFNKKIKQDIEGIKKVLELPEEGYISKYDENALSKKVDVKDFKEWIKRIIGTSKTTNTCSWLLSEEHKTLFERVETIEDKFKALEKYLGIQYTEEKVEGYKKIKKSK